MRTQHKAHRGAERHAVTRAGRSLVLWLCLLQLLYCTPQTACSIEPVVRTVVPAAAVPSSSDEHRPAPRRARRALRVPFIGAPMSSSTRDTRVAPADTSLP